MARMSRMVVTGGAGFIGSHLCRRLVSEGHEVVAIDNLSSGMRENVAPEVKFIHADLADAKACVGLGDGADVVFHLASHVGQELSFENPECDLRSNILGTANVITWCRATGSTRLVLASTMNVYGDPVDASVAVTEASLLQPPSPYAVGKIASENLLDVYRPMGLMSSALRLFNVYGPGQDMANLKQGMVSIFMSYVAEGRPIAVRGSGDRFRDFINVRDVVDAFCLTAELGANGVFNVSRCEMTTVEQLLKVIIEAFGYSVDDYPLEFQQGTPQDQFGLFGNSDRLRNLGWAPSVELRDGIQEMAEWV